MEPTELIDATYTDAVEALAGDDTELVEEELLVEEISIDGMCGVY
ncbi:MAG: mycofactocin precursor [Acidimicrobiaceae bacterium]|nr:mycofactocin precursor [Acidimicrobiaceae bacterium]